MQKNFLIKEVSKYLEAGIKKQKISKNLQKVMPTSPAPNTMVNLDNYSTGGSGSKIVEDQPYYHNDAPKDYNYGG